ncbi:MAG: glycogen debranching N-terminal domain-containing protein [Cyanobacteriota bacterium]|nr:glycogen debranching N-terminal domain-containing protein [Cyanobacteriota bacterium]
MIFSQHLSGWVLKHDDLFLLTDKLGMIPAGSSHQLGLYSQDTRFLSEMEWHLEDGNPWLWQTQQSQPDHLTLIGTSSNGIPTPQITRHLLLRGGLFDQMQIHNPYAIPLPLTVHFAVASDFVDLFEVRGWRRSQRGEQQPLQQDGSIWQLSYHGLDQMLLKVTIEFSHLPTPTTPLTWIFTLPPESLLSFGYRLRLEQNERSVPRLPPPATYWQALQSNQDDFRRWQQEITQIQSDHPPFQPILQQALQDIYALRQTFRRKNGSRATVLAAGIPWYCTLFGRDALIAARQTLILDARLARDTLTLLADYQGQQQDDWREEAPGKILHELRMGEMARCREIPHTPYYGSVDATPLWLMLLGDYVNWTEDLITLQALWPHALAAMGWIDQQSQASGYLTYQAGSSLHNQGWKDSSNCLVDREGRLASPPIALAEVQGYVYAAKLGMSQLAMRLSLPSHALLWQEQAEALKTRFSRDFWMPKQGYCALALDGAGNQVDSITSNPGHCLQTGIFTPSQADQVAQRLMSDDLFSGWGIRTLSCLSPAYDPRSYHNGSVWPHDNSLIALGLRAVGQVELAGRLANALVEMTQEQPLGRPPELFCGYGRGECPQPVPYPVACSPQAWATGSLFHLMEMALDLQPRILTTALKNLPTQTRSDQALGWGEPLDLPAMGHLTLSQLRLGSGVWQVDGGSQTASVDTGVDMGGL